MEKRGIFIVLAHARSAHPDIHGEDLQPFGRVRWRQSEIGLMRQISGHTCLVDLGRDQRIMDSLRRVARSNRPANHGDDALVLAVWRRKMIAQKALGGHPHDRVAGAEDSSSLLLDLWVCEELILPIEAVPHVADQELTRARAGS